MGLRCMLGLRAFGSPTVGILPSLLQDSAEGGFTGQVGAQEGHVPTQDLPRGGGHMGLRCMLGLRAFGSPTVGILPSLLQDSAEGGFTGQVGALIGQCGNDTRRRRVGKPRLIGHLQHRSALLGRQRMGRRGVRGIGSAAPLCKPVLRLPTLQGTHINASELANLTQARAVTVCHLDHMGHLLAIFQSDHSSSPLWKIASSFFESTNSAAVSARAPSSRSSSLMRLRSAAVSLGLARCSCGSASAWVALARQASSELAPENRIPC